MKMLTFTTPIAVPIAVLLQICQFQGQESTEARFDTLVDHVVWRNAATVCLVQTNELDLTADQRGRLDAIPRSLRIRADAQLAKVQLTGDEPDGMSPRDFQEVYRELRMEIRLAIHSVHEVLKEDQLARVRRMRGTG